MSSAKCIMVQGTMSGAGKSLLCAALCRIFAQDGYKTAPFKSQNMALNSFVTRDGLEMGRAQVVQAQAAGVEPDVRMNPILLKPSSDIGSQVIVNGEVRGNMPAKEYFRHKRALIADQRPKMAAGLRALGLHVIDGQANYLLFKAPADFGEALRQHGAVVRSCANYPGLDAAWYRTAVRTAAENDQLLQIIGEVLA